MNDKIVREAIHAHLQMETRRNFIKQSFLGLGGLALGTMMSCQSKPNPSSLNLFDPKNPLAPRPPHFAPKARSVIYLHMAGAPSQLELFDYKPELAKLDGQDCPQSFLEGKICIYQRCSQNVGILSRIQTTWRKWCDDK